MIIVVLIIILIGCISVSFLIDVCVSAGAYVEACTGTLGMVFVDCDPE